MDSVVMAPANTRLRSRVKNNAARSSINKLMTARNHINNKNIRNNAKTNSFRSNANQRHLNFNKNSRCSNNSIVDNAEYITNSIDSKFLCSGGFTREVYNAICHRLGGAFPIPEDSIQASFNYMQLYPTKSQVSDMLQCARQCGRRNGTPKYITFGEFCVFVREMQNQHSNKHRKIQQCKPNNNCVNNCEVFLGGSCNPTTWRTDTAIPELEKHGITFYNPQVSMWVPELVAQEHDAKQAASVLLFVVDSQTRSTVGMIEVAYLVASGRCVVVVAHPYQPGQSIMGETITQREYIDLVEGQSTLLMLVKSRGIKVHSNLRSALHCTANILRNVTNEITAEDQLTNKLRKLREVFDSYTGQGDQMKVRNLPEAYQKLTQRELKIGELYNYLSALNMNVAANINFDEFCTLMAELTTDNCDMCTNGWTSQLFQHQCSTNNNTTCNSHTNGLREEYRPSIDVFLGGTRNSQTNWRKEIAIPILKENNITYSDPTSVNGYEGLDNGYTKTFTEQEILQWKQIMDSVKILLFVITNDTRSLTTMILAAHYIGLGRNVVLSIEPLPEEDCIIGNETVSNQAAKDYNRGRVYVTDMAKRKQIPVFEDITKAVQCVVDKCQQNR